MMHDFEPDPTPFVWKKKYAAEGKEVTPDDMAEISKTKIDELEKLRKRRLEREREREEREAEAMARRREEEAQKFSTWTENEETFILNQAMTKSSIRLKEGRGKPIDKLFGYIRSNNDEREVQQLRYLKPCPFIYGLTFNELLELKQDVNLFKQSNDKSFLNYWLDVEIILEDALEKIQYYSTDAEDQRKYRLNRDIVGDITKHLGKMTSDRLNALKESIELKLLAPDESIDVSFWEYVQRKILVNLARGRLLELHKKMKKNRKEEAERKPKLRKKVETFDDREALIKEYESLNLSPKLIDEAECEKGIAVIEPHEDWSNLEAKRHEIISGKIVPRATAADIKFDSIARKDMGSDEGVIRMEEPIIQDASIASWQEKYRPRKPRYFNRVHTGFEWNKYNQTHYDIDNPPPKIVQGYKFNIFYPDLIEKDKVPTYTVTPCQDNKDFAIIRFKAGPPYEDIAFKIVNKEWNHSHKSGFRSQFANNILQLWFQFKRQRYRR